MRTTVPPLATVVPVLPLAVLVVALPGPATVALLADLPLLAGGLLAAGAALGSWAGWRAGLARRPRPAVAPVPAPVRRRR